MLFVIETNTKTIQMEIESNKDVPNILKTCKALGFTPLRWYISRDE